MRRNMIITGVLGGLLLVGSMVGLVRAQEAGAVRTDVVAGIPVTLYSSGEAAPTVIVAHGFSGSAQMVDPLARGLARSGFTVVTFDFPGHGANPAPLTIAPDARSSDITVLRGALTEVVDWAAAQPEVDRARLSLLGHSMGAIAVTDYAVTDAETDGRINATVALSLPSADDVPDGAPSIPRNLLLLYGSLEQAPFPQAAATALAAGYPGATLGTTYGDVLDGTARKAAEIPGVEHITILFSGDTLQEAATWLGFALDVEPTPTSLPPVLLYAVLALIGGGLLLVPVSRAALGPAPEDVADPVRGWRVLLIVLGASAAASVLAWASGPLQDYIPLAVGGYLIVWFAAAGALAWAAWTIMRRGERQWPAITGRAVAGAAIVGALAVAVVVIPGSMSWAPFAFVGSRAWIAAVILLAFAVYFGADELLVRRTATGARFGLTVVNRLIAVGVLLASIPLLQAPGFLILLLPVLLLFFLILAWYAAVVGRCRNGYLAAVLVQALPAAALVATTFPLVS